MTRGQATLLPLAVLMAVACTAGPDDSAQLLPWMTGSFSSAAQAAEDSAFYDVRLHMTQVWTDRADGPWIYVEQAMGTDLERPYRQRVYQLVERADSMESLVYELPEPLRFAGAWRDGVGSLTPDSLVLRDGCAVVLTWQGDHYAGSTRGDECRSTLRGALYATSQVIVRSDRIESWDRGFSGDGSQVWGATEGAYVFRRDSR